MYSRIHIHSKGKKRNFRVERNPGGIHLNWVIKVTIASQEDKPPPRAPDVMHWEGQEGSQQNRMQAQSQ